MLNDFRFCKMINDPALSTLGAECTGKQERFQYVKKIMVLALTEEAEDIFSLTLQRIRA